MVGEYNVKEQNKIVLFILKKTKHPIKSKHNAKDEKLIHVKSWLATTLSYPGVKKKKW